MGEHTETIAADISGKDHRCRSCEAHDVSVSSKDDRGGSKSVVGEG